MYKDLHRIEDALLPCLFRHAIICIIGEHPTDKALYEAEFEMLTLTIEKCFEGLLESKKKQLRRRLSRVVTIITDHFVANDFRVIKLLLTLSQWATYMHVGSILKIPEDSSYYKFLLSIEEDIEKRSTENAEDFEKIHNSAMKHIPKVHAIAQQQGYFL